MDQVGSNNTGFVKIVNGDFCNGVANAGADRGADHQSSFLVVYLARENKRWAVFPDFSPFGRFKIEPDKIISVRDVLYAHLYSGSLYSCSIKSGSSSA